MSSHSLQPNDFIPIHSCRGHMDDEHVKFVYTFLLGEKYNIFTWRASTWHCQITRH